MGRDLERGAGAAREVLGGVGVSGPDDTLLGVARTKDGQTGVLQEGREYDELPLGRSGLLELRRRRCGQP